jgi:sialate O-acetylesterase
MVLQAGIDIPVWGTAKPGELVQVQFSGNIRSTKADKSGNWQVFFPKMSYGGPYRLTVKGKNLLSFDNIMIGEVWICSGQSNMELALRFAQNGSYAIKHAENPLLWLFTVLNDPTVDKTQTISSFGWKECTPQNVADFSAVGYFFARELSMKYNVAVGIISSCVGATPIEAWMSRKSLSEFPEFENQLNGDLLKAKSDLNASLSSWINRVNASDAGFSENKPLWANPETDASNWQKMNLPGFWEYSGLPDFDGIVWFRKEVNISGDMLGKDLLLQLRGADDFDQTYFNGTLIGTTNGWGIPRRYSIPEKLVKKGLNTIAIRVIDAGGNGGVFGNKSEMMISSANSQINVSGEWFFKIGADNKMLHSRPCESFSTPSILYNRMIAPLQRFPLRGVVWYQGESNSPRYKQYERLFPALINDWRKEWKIGDFPFLFVQLANYEEGGENWAFFREVQSRAQALPRTGMAVAIDIGDAQNIHPTNKQEVGHRLALAAMKVAYGENLISSGPSYEYMSIEESAVRIIFSNTGTGLVAPKNEELRCFFMAGNDKVFYPANAHIEGNTVVVESPDVLSPKAIRYAWNGNPDRPNLYNKEGLPCVPFRTDDW